jgi:hypothetical protein
MNETRHEVIHACCRLVSAVMQNMEAESGQATNGQCAAYETLTDALEFLEKANKLLAASAKKKVQEAA